MGEVFSDDFRPILLPNETATLKGSQFPTEGQPVMCAAVGALPEYYKDFGSLTAAKWDSDNEDTNLELGSKELAQFRMEILDDFKLQLKNPAPVEQWRTSKENFYLRMFPVEPDQDWLKKLLFKMSEFYVYEQDTPRFDLYAEVAQSQSRVIFRGWKLKVKEITEKELTSKQIIWVNGWPTSKE